jgi:hypothetical protein
MSFRSALHRYLLDPLNIPAETLDSFRTPKMDATRAELEMLDASADTFGPSSIPFDTPQYEDYGTPDPDQYFAFGSAPLWGHLSSMATIFASCLKTDGPIDHRTGQPLMSRNMWEQCTEDALAVRYNTTIKQGSSSPFLKSTMPPFSESIETYKRYKGGDEEDESIGWSILQCTVLKREVRSGPGSQGSPPKDSMPMKNTGPLTRARVRGVHRLQSETGLQPGTLGWAGLANT